MSNYQNILAVIDNNNSQNLVRKALALSKRSNSEITFLNLNDEDNSIPAISPANLSTRFIDQNKINVIKAKTNKAYSAISEELSNNSYDLIIKDKITKHHNYMGISPCDDWKLLRNSSAPLMLVTKTQWQSHGHLLTAIETEEKTSLHNALNRDILEHSYRLSEQLASKVHLINCYLGEDPSISLTSSSLGMNFISQKDLHWQHLKMLSGNNLEIDQELHLQQGIPETEISLMAIKYDVNMVIIGTAEHNSLVGTIFGHTSEYIIDELQCDVLAVKNSVTHH